MKTIFLYIALLSFFCCFSFNAQAIAEPSFQEDFFEKLLAFHEVKKPPNPQDWLANHPEPGQGFSEFLKQNAVIPDSARHTIYITLLGDFDKTRKRIIEESAAFMRAYYQMPVKFTDPIPLSAVAESARRVHPVFGDRQIQTRYVIEEILVSAKPDDAFCLIAFTTSDLWPGPGWNFVFGEASLPDRVGIFSIHRNGIPTKSKEDYNLCLLRTIKTGTHEVGHMFGVHHCIFYECAMNGSNHRQESDQRPLYLCPIDLKKMHHAIRFDNHKRFNELEALSNKHGFSDAASYYKKARENLLGSD